MRHYLFVAALAALGTAGCSSSEGPSDSGDVCEQAFDIVEECTGERPDSPPEGCVGEFQTYAQTVVDEGCSAINGSDKADGFFCSPSLQFLGQCDAELSHFAQISSIESVCPESRTDDLCDALRAQDWASARDAVKPMMTPNLRLQGIGDPAVQYFIRERIVSLVVWNKLTEDGAKAPPSDYASRAYDALSEHYPAYPNGQFPLAQAGLAPEDTSGCSSNTAVVYFPGVVRGATKEGFKPQLDKVQEVLPCLDAVRVDTGNFIHPIENAKLGATTVADLDPNAELIVMGYSQGSSNAMRLLADFPDIAERVQSVLVLNSAAHGSEVANVLHLALGGLENSEICDGLYEWLQPTCESLGDKALALVESIMEAQAITVDLLGNLDGHLAGVRSLTTDDAEKFWTESGDNLPRTALYTSFRAVITGTDANLPGSNALFFKLLERVGGENPYNDMQVRLPNQSLGGPVADIEVELPVAEGNHWQWELNSVDVSTNLMPASMTENIPQTGLAVAYFQTMFEIGIIR